MRKKSVDGAPVMANEFEAGTTEPIRDAHTTLLASGSGGRSAIVFLDPDKVNLQHIPGRHDEIGDGPDPSLGRPFGFEIVGLDGGHLGGEVRRRVGDESGGAVLDPGGPVHHLEGGVAHLDSWLGFI